MFTGRPVSEVARSLGIGENLIYKWESRSRLAGKPVAGGTGADLSQADALRRALATRTIVQGMAFCFRIPEPDEL